MAKPDFVIIAGPTASGKSALALLLAKQLAGVIINADSMQVYAGLDVITATPEAKTRRLVPHYLFGHRNPAEAYSVGQWLKDAGDVYETQARTKSRPGVFVGGSGLYIKAALNGIAPIPPIADEARQQARALLASLGAATVHAELAQHDPEFAAATKPGDRQRLVRGMEVWLATNKPLSDWQKAGRQGRLAGRGLVVYIRPPRAPLYARINQRFQSMLENGAMDEVRAFQQRDIPPQAPALKALGLQPLLAVVSGKLSREEAAALAMRDSRRYAKRQYTWFDHQLDGQLDGRTGLQYRRIDALLGASNLPNLAAELCKF